MSEASAELDLQVRQLVAILFLAGEAADRRAVQRALELNPAQLERVVHAAQATDIPVLLVQAHGDVLRLVTHPDSAAAARRFTQSPNAIRLSTAALETLAVIAYGQPTTRSQIQEARGVNSDGPITTLLQHGLIAEAGRADTVGHPMLFETTAECLALLGLASIDDLPALTPEGPRLVLVPSAHTGGPVESGDSV